MDMRQLLAIWQWLERLRLLEQRVVNRDLICPSASMIAAPFFRLHTRAPALRFFLMSLLYQASSRRARESGLWSHLHQRPRHLDLTRSGGAMADQGRRPCV